MDNVQFLVTLTKNSRKNESVTVTGLIGKNSFRNPSIGPNVKRKLVNYIVIN